MHILILGGTAFVGRALAVEAISRGHKVTLFNRGTKPSPEGTTTIIGDRLSPDSLKPLEKLTFDAAIDTWSLEPEPAIRAMQVLHGRVGHYTYISALSVYDNKAIKPGGNLNNETAKLFDVTAADATKSVYQFNKRTVEIAAERIFKGTTPVLLARPGVILGPYEAPHIERGRLPWWLHRLHRGGPTLAPGPEDMNLQIVDVRDLANFVLDGIEAHRQGAYNIVGDYGEVTMGRFLNACRECTGKRATLVWKTAKEITDSDIIPFMEVPLWLDPGTGMYASVYRWDVERARGAGLRCRDVEDTVRDTWEWMGGGDGPVMAPEGSDSKRGGLSWEKEARVLGME